ncbi:MAG TPA: serine/threonine-protein kinase, partial [Polyangiaceae bacterium]|nr:serine/threonine-protein kinase [Polyangiaceae bacterium]
MATRVTSLEPGTVFAGDYKVVQLLSEGGMGSVYVAEQISTGKQRALKLMLPQLVADPRLRTRFEQEARIGSKIDSEHVVEVVAAGVDQAFGGVPWLAMELLRGETLAAYVARHGPLHPRAMLEIMEQVCHAIGAAHDAGVVHRDLKPENVFVAQARRTGSNYMIKVLDFGIAKVVAEAKTSETAAIGSPMWMAPEQTARGSDILPQTDVWSIGLIVFNLLTRRFFWRAAEDEAASITHVLREIVIDPIPLLSQRAMEVNCHQAFPPGFDAWFARSVDRSVHARFPNANVQLAELKRIFAPWVTMPMAQTPTPSVPRTVPQMPLYAAQPHHHSTTGGMVGAPPPSRSGGTGVLPFVVGGLLLVVVGGGVLLLTVGKTLLTGNLVKTEATESATATTPVPVPTAEKKPSLNAWMTIEAAATPLKLGVADEKTSDPGFRPSRNILAPRTSYDIQQHEVTWAELEPYLAEHTE